MKLTDTWDVVDQKREIEAWWKYTDGDHIERTGPARISRGMKPAKVEPSDLAMPDNITANGDNSDDIVRLKEPLVPFMVSAKHPCGAVSVGALARTQGRECVTPLCEIELELGDADTVGAFGYYGKLILNGVKSGARILMQDLAGDSAYDVTGLCDSTDGRLTIPGELINTLGRLENPVGDTSAPGVILRISQSD